MAFKRTIRTEASRWPWCDQLDLEIAHNALVSTQYGQTQMGIEERELFKVYIIFL